MNFSLGGYIKAMLVYNNCVYSMLYMIVIHSGNDSELAHMCPLKKHPCEG